MIGNVYRTLMTEQEVCAGQGSVQNRKMCVCVQDRVLHTGQGLIMHPPPPPRLLLPLVMHPPRTEKGGGRTMGQEMHHFDRRLG
jgi:hypothetical protein